MEVFEGQFHYILLAIRLRLIWFDFLLILLIFH